MQIKSAYKQQHCWDSVGQQRYLKKKIKLQINTNQGNSLHDAIKILNSTLWKQTTEN